MKFKLKYPTAPVPTDNFIPPSKWSLSLAFFVAYLFELDSINSYSTIRNYVSHVTQFYLKNGCSKKKLNSPLLKAVMRGVKRCMPPQANSRIAFLLIHYHIPRRFTKSRPKKEGKALAAISFGFFAMLRFHSYGKFCWDNLTLVLEGGREITPTVFNQKIIQNLIGSNCITGFYFTFQDKFHPVARAYFCKIGDLNKRLRLICPLNQLLTLSKVPRNGMFFPDTVITRTALTECMRDIANTEKNVKPHSLRIGGHTYYTVYGLDSDFRDYLARRKVKNSTMTYYRASPYLTICKLRHFFKRMY